MAIWAEIKKAINSNLDKPLNELIAEKSGELLTLTQNNSIVNSANVRTVTDSFTNTSKTLLEVTGSGKFILASMNGSGSNSGKYHQLKIIIDGEVAFYIRRTNSNNSNYITSVTIGSTEYILVMNTSNVYIAGVTGSLSLASSSPLVTGNGDTLVNISDGNGGGILCPITPILFKQSLKVEAVTTCTSTCTSVVIYELD